ncbi:MAG TPA: hypothetical protein VF179_03045 [Thermoanaerobaculia bacterium]|nr:hypothetical protein [Thermoanaerobaculia bacterium]
MMQETQLPDKLELKPERVQQEMARQLGWAERKSVRGIHRTRVFDNPVEAEAFAAFALKAARRRRQPVTVSQWEGQVSITLKGRAGRGIEAGLTDAVYDLACVLG